jgi:hypothetical protein
MSDATNDWLSRSLANFAGLMAQAQREWWHLIALDLGIDLSTPAGEFMANVMSWAAQWERRITGQHTVTPSRSSGPRSDAWPSQDALGRRGAPRPR